MAGPQLWTSWAAYPHVVSDLELINDAIDDLFTKTAYSQDYGVTGDGVADDTAAFQAFLTAATTAGLIAQLESGSTVKVTSTVSPPTGCRLDLNGATIKNAAAGTTDRMLTLSGVSDVWIGNGTLNGDKASYAPTTEQRHNLHIINSQRVTVENVISKLAKGDGVYVGDQIAGYSSDIRLLNVTCDANHRQGMTISHVDGFTAVNCRFINTSGTAPQAGVDIEPNSTSVLCSNIKFIGCQFNGNTGAGFEVIGQASPSVRQGDIDLVDCTIAANGATGFQLRDTTNIRMLGGDVRGNTNEGIYIANSTGTLSTDLKFIGVACLTNTKEGLRITTGEAVSGMVVSGCSFVGNGTATPNNYAGINLDSLAGTQHIRIIGNWFDGADQRYGVRTTANVSNLTMIGNSYGTLGTASTSLADDTATRYILERGLTATVKQQYTAGGGSTMLEFLATGDSVARLAARTDGALTFSSGSATQDTILQRAAASVLAIGADDSFKTGRNVTASRPSPSSAGQGSMFYDTTLSKPIWSDGTVWRDAAGSAV